MYFIFTENADAQVEKLIQAFEEDEILPHIKQKLVSWTSGKLKS